MLAHPTLDLLRELGLHGMPVIMPEGRDPGFSERHGSGGRPPGLARPAVPRPIRHFYADSRSYRPRQPPE